MATIKDVASLASVSTATVSRVINQTAWVEPLPSGAGRIWYFSRPSLGD
ncbi:hypothetical protein DRU47_01170 [Salmonella enterica subsp. enterica serovar Corvallis]|nr:hypothetical protein [Salmonella enterica subsp. enterica serovar Corvallis]